MRLISSVLVVALAVVGCSRDGRSTTPAGEEMPPLPPSSGTAVGYLLDNSTQLKLSGEQFDKLKQIDTSLSARNDSIDTQLREIEIPVQDEPADKNAPPPVRAKNMAPGAAAVHTTADASKLHEARDIQTRDALVEAFALLDATQQVEARKLLAARGIPSPKPSATSSAAPP